MVVNQDSCEKRNESQEGGIWEYNNIQYHALSTFLDKWSLANPIYLFFFFFFGITPPFTVNASSYTLVTLPTPKTLSPLSQPLLLSHHPSCLPTTPSFHITRHLSSISFLPPPPPLIFSPSSISRTSPRLLSKLARSLSLHLPPSSFLPHSFTPSFVTFAVFSSTSTFPTQCFHSYSISMLNAAKFHLVYSW